MNSLANLFSEPALGVVDEIDGTLMLALAERRISLVEIAATLRFLEQKYSTMVDAVMTDASEEEALGDIDDEPPPPSAEQWKGGA